MKQRLITTQAGRERRERERERERREREKGERERGKQRGASETKTNHNRKAADYRTGAACCLFTKHPGPIGGLHVLPSV